MSRVHGNNYQFVSETGTSSPHSSTLSQSWMEYLFRLLSSISIPLPRVEALYCTFSKEIWTLVLIRLAPLQVLYAMEGSRFPFLTHLIRVGVDENLRSRMRTFFSVEFCPSISLSLSTWTQPCAPSRKLLD